MSKDLQYLLQFARQYKMTDEEREEQVCSFAYGNTHLENETITKQDIQEAMVRLRRQGGQPRSS